MNVDDIKFAVIYSYYVEKMNQQLLNRIDRAITLILIVLGFSVFAPISNMFVVGASVALLSVLQLVYQFGPEAGLSKEQMRQYKRLMVEMETITETQLRERFIRLQDSDSSPWQSLQNTAFKRSCIHLNRKDETRLSFKESIISWIAGDLPRT